MYVKGFPATATKEQLEEKFSEIGEIIRVDLQHKSKSFVMAYVHFEDENNANFAIEILNNTEFMGQTLFVSKFTLKQSSSEHSDTSSLKTSRRERATQ